MTKTLTRTGKRTLVGLLVAAMLFTLAFPLQVRAESYTADTTFTFTDSGITASGSEDGYKIEGTDLTINGAGTYVVTGSCSEGSIKVKKETTGVTLVVKDLTLASSTTAPISCNKTTEVKMILEGTSTITDKEDPANEESTDAAVADAFEGAALKVKSGATLTISGTGTLTADGSSCKNAIKGAATASITVESGTINAKAANNGLASDGNVVINGGKINVTAGNDGIKAEPDEDDTDSAGTVTINGGSIYIDVTGDGIQATGDVTINGGTLTIEADDDAIHGDSNVILKGGTLTINAGDDAIKAESILTFGTKGSTAGPDITVRSCNEGFEGAEIYMYSGSANVKATDDGINAANSDLTNYNFMLDIEGGTWTINSGGDGVDSNKDIVVNGGTTIVYGPTNSGNGALDYEGSCMVNSGELLCIGSSGMAMAPSSGTYVMFGAGGQMGGMGGQRGQMGQMPGQMGGQRGQMGQQTGQTGQTTQTTQTAISITAGSTIAIKDASGNTLIETTSPKAATNVMSASGDLTSGSTYTLYVNGTQAATTTAAAGNGQGGMQPGGNGGQQPTDGTMPTPPDGTQPADGTMPTPPDQSGTSVAGFTDVKTTDWFAQAVQYVSSAKYMNGTSAATFEPNTNLSRGMIVQILYNMEGKPAVSEASSYTDISDSDWYADAVAWAEDNDIVQGYGGGKFGATDSLTREQAATILNRYAEYKGLDVTASANLSSYSDASKVSDWAKSAMQWAVGSGIISGTSATTLDPAGTTTRAQMAQILMNMK